MKKLISVLILAAFLAVALAVTSTAADGITVNLIVVDVTAPKDGEMPVYSAKTKSEAYSVYEIDDESFANGVMWEEEFDDELDLGWTCFEEGKKYILCVMVKLRDGFTVNEKADGSPDVSVKVNGNDAEASWRDKFGDNNILIIKYVFTADRKPLKQLADVALIVPPPALDRAPTFTAFTDREHFTIEDVVWHDGTKGERLDENDRFEAGHEYTVYVTVLADDGYMFFVDDSGIPQFVPTINGIAANATNYGTEKNGIRIVVSFIFPIIEEVTTAEQTTAETVEATTEPTAEQTAEITHPSTYEATAEAVISTQEPTAEPTTLASENTAPISTKPTAASTTASAGPTGSIIVNVDTNDGCGSTLGAGASLATVLALLVTAAAVRKKKD